MTFAALYAAADGLVAIADGLTSTACGETRPSRKVAIRSVGRHKILWVVAGRASFGKIPAAKVLEDMPAPRAGTSPAQWARWTLCEVGALCEKDPVTKNDNDSFYAVVGGQQQHGRPELIRLDVDMDGRGLSMSPREETDPPFLSVGSAQGVAGILVEQRDPRKVSAHQLAKDLRAQAQRYGRWPTDVGGTWTVAAVTSAGMTTSNFEAGTPVPD